MPRNKRPRRPAHVEYRGVRARATRPPNQTGLWSWAVQRQVEGRRHTRGLGRLTRDGAADALRALVETGWPIEAAPAPRSAPTVRELVNLYLEHQAQRVEAGQIRARTLEVNVYAARRLGDLLDAELGELDGAAVLAWMARVTFAPGTLRNSLVLLGGCSPCASTTTAGRQRGRPRRSGRR